MFVLFSQHWILTSLRATVPENLLTSESGKVPDTGNSMATMSEGNLILRSYATDINNLNLLGESGEGEEIFARKSSPSNTGAFCVDELNL